MATILQILAGLALAFALVGIPNLGNGRDWVTIYITFGMPIAIAAIGHTIRRLDKLERILESRPPQKPAA